MVREYAKEYYFKKFKKVLRNRELTIADLTARLELPRSTVQRWVDIFVASGLLEERWDGNKKFVRVKR